MGTTVAALTHEVIGRRLGQNLYNRSGNLLLRKGVEINDRFFQHFIDNGYRSIFLLGKNPDEKVIKVSSDRLLCTAPYLLKKIFRKLKLDDTVYSRQAKLELMSLAESIFVHVNNTLQRPLQILELKRQEDYLYQHCVNVAVYSIYIGRKLNFPDKKLLKLALSALLHDFGMEFIDNAIVNKATKLEQQEFEHVKKHTTKGFSHLVRNCSFDGLTTVASVQHHERFDGRGYPKSLGGEDIHEFSRIISLTDTFDAWTSDRPHRRLYSIEKSIEFIQKNKNQIFDPILVESFTEIFS